MSISRQKVGGRRADDDALSARVCVVRVRALRAYRVPCLLWMSLNPSLVDFLGQVNNGLGWGVCGSSNGRICFCLYFPTRSTPHCYPTCRKCPRHPARRQAQTQYRDGGASSNSPWISRPDLSGHPNVQFALPTVFLDLSVSGGNILVLINLPSRLIRRGSSVRLLNQHQGAWRA